MTISRKLEQLLLDSDARDGVWIALAEPDRDMLDAGVGELNLALGRHGHPQGTAHRRALVRVIWRAMIDRARYR